MSEADTQVTIRTHKGSGERNLTLERLKEVSHLPQQEAADILSVGNTRFKSATRQLGMRAWPYRKIKSIRNLKAVVEANPCEFQGKGSEVLDYLNQYEELIFQNPQRPLTERFKKFRQAAYKRAHIAKRKHPKSPAKADDTSSQDV